MNKDKETMAREYADKSSRHRPSIAWTIQDVRDAYLAGFDAGQAQLLEQAAIGFGEYEKTIEHREGYIYIAREAWQASALHSAKLLAEKAAEIQGLRDSQPAYNEDIEGKLDEVYFEIAEKDREIKTLKEKIEELDYCQKAFWEATKKVGW